MNFKQILRSAAFVAAAVVSQGALADFMPVSSGFEPGVTENCVSQAEMQTIATHFRQFQELANKGEYCFDGSHESHLIAGIMFMRKTQFANPMPESADELFSGRFASDWYQYFIGRIDEFQIPATCPKGVGAYVYFWGTTMYVCPMLLSDDFTALDRASVMMHEARHIDGFPHVTCRRGPRAGLSGACDNRISDGGSYAVTVETYAQLSRYAEGIHPALKAYSRANAVVYADEAFDTPVQIHRTPQLLLLTTQGEFHTLTLKNGIETEQLGNTPALGRIVMRGSHMILYPEDRTLKSKYVFARNEGDIQQTAGDISTEYNSSTPQQRAEWVDVHLGTQWSARVLKRSTRIGCDPRSDATTEMDHGGQIAASLIYPNGYDRGSKTIHLVMQSGRIYELGCTGTRPFLRPSNVSFDQNYKRIHKLGDTVVGLTADGRLFKIQGSTSTPLQTSLDGRVYEIAPYQMVEFFDGDHSALLF